MDAYLRYQVIINEYKRLHSLWDQFILKIKILQSLDLAERFISSWLNPAKVLGGWQISMDGGWLLAHTSLGIGLKTNWKARWFTRKEGIYESIYRNDGIGGWERILKPIQLDRCPLEKQNEIDRNVKPPITRCFPKTGALHFIVSKLRHTALFPWKAQALTSPYDVGAPLQRTFFPLHLYFFTLPPIVVYIEKG